MDNDDIRYRQGRSKKQYETNEMVTMFGFVSFAIIILIIIFQNLIKSL